MMAVCPVCNGLKDVYLLCAKCGETMTDFGRITDYYDDYSAYMEIDLMKMEDGFPDTNSKHKCPHLFRCPQCHDDEIYLIKE